MRPLDASIDVLRVDTQLRSSEKELGVFLVLQRAGSAVGAGLKAGPVAPHVPELKVRRNSSIYCSKATRWTMSFAVHYVLTAGVTAFFHTYLDGIVY